MPLVTVITAAKNAAKLLPDTIASIQSQTVTDWRHVIVDDGSEDDTAAVVDRFAANDSRIELIRLDKSIGPYPAANLAARTASSRFIARIDGDDVALPNRLAAQLAALEVTPSARGCAGAYLRLLPSGLNPTVFAVPAKSNRVIKWMMWFRSNLVHSTLMIETERFAQLGGYGPEPVGEDFRIWASLVRADELVVIDDPLVQYRYSAGQMVAAPNARDQAERIRISLDHIDHCAPTGGWTFEDARDLRWVGETAPYKPARALELLDRFEAVWRRDPGLSTADRRELARHTANRRLRHLRHALTQSPSSVAWAAMRGAPSVLRSAATVVANRGPAWP
jgi:hypothetical protein